MNQSEMQSFWQANGVNRRTGRKRARSVDQSSENVVVLRELTGNSLTPLACCKLLSDHEGNVELAANAFFQLEDRDVERLNRVAEGDTEGGDDGHEVFLPAEAVEFPEVLTWMKLQLESLGCLARFTPKPKGHEKSTMSSSLSSATCLSSHADDHVPCTSEGALPDITVDTELVQSLIKREKAEQSAGGYGYELKVASLMTDLKQLSNAGGGGTVHPEPPKQPPAGLPAEGVAAATPQEMFDAAKYQYTVELAGGDEWACPPAVLSLPPPPAQARLRVLVANDAEDPSASSQHPLRLAANTAATKVRGFVRYGNVRHLQSFVAVLESMFPDTKVFHKAEGNKHIFVACGIAAELCSRWLSGPVVRNVSMDPRVFKQTEGLAELMGTVVAETGCAFFFREAHEEGSVIGILGPQPLRDQALALINSHEHVREVILRVPPTYSKLIDTKSSELQDRLGCKLRVEGGGRVRVVGRADNLAAARDVIGQLVQLMGREVQKSRLQEVARSLTINVLKVEVRVKLPERLKNLLCSPSAGPWSNMLKSDGTLKWQERSVEDTQRRATVLWASTDALVDEMTRLLISENVISRPEEFDIGAVALDVRVGDTVERAEAWSGGSEREARPSRLLQELMVGDLSTQQHPFKQARVVRVEPGIQEGGQNFQSVVSDWIMCSIDPSRPDPGRPSCDIVVVNFDHKGKQVTQNIPCPGTKMLLPVQTQREPHAVLDCVRETLRLSYFASVDEMLLDDLQRAVMGMQPDGAQRKYTVLERCRQRCKEVFREAESEHAKLVQMITALPEGKIREALTRQAERIEQVWSHSSRMAVWELETVIGRVRDTLEEEARRDRWNTTCLEAIQKITAQTGAYIDYAAPNDFVAVSGSEKNVRAAVGRLNDILSSGAKGLEDTHTEAVGPEEAAKLSDNNGFLLHLIAQETGLKEAKVDGSQLVLSGTKHGIAQALGYIGKPDPWREESEDVCRACLMDSFGDEAEDNRMVELLCGHKVHYGCVAKSMLAVHSMNAEEGCTTRTPCKCPITSCRYTLTPQEYSVLYDGCTTSRAQMPEPLSNIGNIVAQLVHTQDRVRTCPGCSKWVIASSYTEPLCCMHCGFRFCGQRNPACDGVPHYFTTCEQFVKAKSRSEGKVNATAVPTNVVICAKCPAWILREDDQGDEKCRYMKCRQCTYEFCWLCLRPSLDHRHYNPQNLTEQVECDPDKREERRERLMRAHEVALWKGYVSCDRCGKTYDNDTQEPLHGCLQCLNQYLCHQCVPAGCPVDATHVIGEVPTEEAPNRAKTEGVSCAKGHALTSQENHTNKLLCDKCGRNGKPANYVGCNLCNYHICKQCTDATRPGGEVLDDPHLRELEIPREFWDAWPSSQLSLPCEPSTTADSADSDKKLKLGIMNFVCGRLPASGPMIQSSHPNILAALLGLQR